MLYTAMRREPLIDASGLNRFSHPRRLKKILEALITAQIPLTAADLSFICDLNVNTVVRYLLTLKAHGYPIHTRQQKTPRATEYRLVAKPPTQRD